MATRLEMLTNILDTVVNGFSELAFDSDLPYKLIQGTSITKEQMRELLTKEKENATNEIRRNINSLIKELDLNTKLEELEELTERCKKENEVLGVSMGYRPIGAVIDTFMHCRNAIIAPLEPVDEEIELLERELQEAEKELELHNKELKELSVVIKQQQDELAEIASENNKDN